MDKPLISGWVGKRIEGWRDFMSCKSGPALKIFAELPCGKLGAEPKKWPVFRKERVESIWRRYLWDLENRGDIADDYIPFINVGTGTEIFAEAFGCPVDRPDHTMPFALPLIRTAAEVSKLKVPKLGHCALDYLFEMADELKSRAGNEALFGLVDMQSPMDIANLIWDKTSLLMALYDSPEAVKELSSKVRELLCAFLDEWFCRYGRSFIAHYPKYYMEKGLTLSVDEVGVVNQEMFEEFFAEELAHLSARYGGIGIHCCADSRHQWGNFKKTPGLKLINFCKPPIRGPEHCFDALMEFKDICAQWHIGWTPDGDMETWASQYPGGVRAVVHICADNVEDAKRKCGKLREGVAKSKV